MGPESTLRKEYEDRVDKCRERMGQQMQDVMESDCPPDPSETEQLKAALGFVLCKLAEMSVEIEDLRRKAAMLNRRTVGQIRMGGR